MVGHPATFIKSHWCRRSCLRSDACCGGRQREGGGKDVLIALAIIAGKGHGTAVAKSVVVGEGVVMAANAPVAAAEAEVAWEAQRGTAASATDPSPSADNTKGCQRSYSRKRAAVVDNSSTSIPRRIAGGVLLLLPLMMRRNGTAVRA